MRGALLGLALAGMGLLCCGGEPTPEEIAECSAGCKTDFRNGITDCDDQFFSCGDQAQSGSDILGCNTDAKQCSIKRANDATNCAEGCGDTKLAQGYICLRGPIDRFYQCQHVAFVEAFDCTASQGECVNALQGKTGVCAQTLTNESAACE